MSKLISELPEPLRLLAEKRSCAKLKVWSTVSGSFSWLYTPEGHTFWQRVAGGDYTQEDLQYAQNILNQPAQ